jgi:hypothetical protein
MRKASTELLEQGIQAPSLAPDLIPAEPLINRELTLELVQLTGALQGVVLQRVSTNSPAVQFYEFVSWGNRGAPIAAAPAAKNKPSTLIH